MTWPLRALGFGASVLAVAAACGRIEGTIVPGEGDGPLDAAEVTDSTSVVEASLSDAGVTSCARRGASALLYPWRSWVFPPVGPSLVVSPSVVVQTGPTVVSAEACGPSGRNPAPAILGPSLLSPARFAATCAGSGSGPLTGTGLALLRDAEAVAAAVQGTAPATFHLVHLRWPDADASVRFEPHQFGVGSAAGGVAYAHAIEPEGSRLRVAGGTGTDPRAVVASFDLAAAEAQQPEPALKLVEYVEPRLVSFDVLSRRGDGTFWASGRTAGGALAVVRFGKDELPDAAFGDRGLLVVPGTADVRATKVLALADGGALLGAVTGAGEATVRRVTAAGALDTSYGGGGVLRSPWLVGGHILEGRAQLVLERSGAVRFAGIDTVDAGTGPRGEPVQPVRVTRFLPSGAVDVEFGESGTARTSFELPPGRPLVLLEASEELDACAGKLVVGVFTTNESPNGGRPAGGGVATLVP